VVVAVVIEVVEAVEDSTAETIINQYRYYEIKAVSRGAAFFVT
jgi:hypothetical protein